MDLNRIATFVAVVEAESFTGAATRLGIPKSSVSRSITALEEELGAQLLRRTTRKVTLTEAGEAYYRHVQPAIAGLVEANSFVTQKGRELRGTIRLTVPIEAACTVVPKLVVRFTREHPKVRVELAVTNRRVDLVAEGLDMALRAGKLSDSTLIARKVMNTDFALFASPEYLDRRGRPRTLRELADHECVIFRGKRGRATWRLTGPDGVEGSVEVQGRIEADSLAFVAQAVAEGAGIGMLPSHVSVPLPTSGRLERVLPEYASEAPPVYLVVPGGKFIPPHVLAFRDFLLRELRTEWRTPEAFCGTGRA